MIKEERRIKEKNGDSKGFLNSEYASMDELAYPNYCRCHDYIKFLVKVL